MKYRTFPGTDVRVSEVGFGTWTISTGWWGEKTDDEAVAMLRRALDEHRRHVLRRRRRLWQRPRRAPDRRSVSGRRERDRDRHEGRLRHLRREAQKSRRGQNELPMRTDPAFIRIAVDRCLERLETDYIDVLQIHNAKMEHVRDAELWGTLRELAARRKDPGVGRGVRAGDRLAVRGRRSWWSASRTSTPFR